MDLLDSIGVINGSGIGLKKNIAAFFFDNIVVSH